MTSKLISFTMLLCMYQSFQAMEISEKTPLITEEQTFTPYQKAMIKLVLEGKLEGFQGSLALRNNEPFDNDTQSKLQRVIQEQLAQSREMKLNRWNDTVKKNLFLSGLGLLTMLAGSASFGYIAAIDYAEPTTLEYRLGISASVLIGLVSGIIVRPTARCITDALDNREVKQLYRDTLAIKAHFENYINNNKSSTEESNHGT